VTQSEFFFDAKGIYQTEHAFLERSAAYHDFMSLDDESKGTLARLETDLGFPDRIIDLGCGTGNSLLPVGPQIIHDSRIVGVDISTAALLALKVGRESADNLKLICADICNLPFRDSSADLAIARHMLYHVHDLERALAEVGRVLGPCGCFLVTTNSVLGKAELFDLNSRALAQVSGARRILRGSGNFSAEEGRAILLTAFIEVCDYKWQGIFRFPTEESAARYYLNTLYFQKSFDDADRRKRLEDVARTLIRQTISEQGAFIVSNAGSAFLARRWRGGR
jgi:SAM-dependent methyltransferase